MDLTDEERLAEDLAAASRRCLLAERQLIALQNEWIAMDAQYGPLDRQFNGQLAVGRGNFADVISVNRWFEDFKVREDAARKESMDALMAFGALKPDTSVSQTHLPDGWNAVNYKQVRHTS